MTDPATEDRVDPAITDGEPSKPRFAALRRYGYSLDHAGLFIGVIFFAASLMPSLLPRTWLVQGLASGISLAFGYAIGVVLAWVGRRLVHARPSTTVRHWTRRAAWAFALVLIPLMLWLGSAWQDDIRHAVHYPAESRYLYLGVLLMAALTGAALLGVGRLLRDLSRRLEKRLLRHRASRRTARLVAVVLVALLAWGFVAGVIGNTARAVLDSVASNADHGTHPNTVRPTSALRSGSPDSAVSWDSLGLEGRTFIAGGPTAAQITELTGRPAMPPIRVYAGRESASSLEGEASLVLAELKRTHAFDRAVLAVGTSTGTGWINPWQPDSLEYMFGGDTAVASMQYSFYPSWISFLIDRPRAMQAGRDLFNTVNAYWSTLPKDHRPRLLAFGESLGSYGGSGAFTSIDDVLARSDGALFTGPPNSTANWRALTAGRQAGSPERLPVIGDGQSIRFSANPKDLREPDGTLSHPHVVFVQHGSDPIVWWSPSLLFNKPDWMSEPRAPDVIPQVHWYPIVTFWTVTCDMIAAASPPAGYGHDYGAEVITAWQAILHPPGWTDADTKALAAQGP